MIERSTKIRVRYSHTDQMGVVYYGNYPSFYEIGRSEFMRDLGLSYLEVEKGGVVMPVVEMSCRYHKPFFYDDLIEIKTVLKQLPTSSIEFYHEMYNSNVELCHTGKVKLGFINMKTLRPVRVPDIVLECLKKAINNQ